MSPQLERELGELAVVLAEGAGRAVETGRRGEMTVATKSTRTDLVTQVDRRTEAYLVDQIRRHRPDDAVLGEEGGERSGTSGVRWVLDPIDGTVNFVLGLPAYAVSVAAELDGVVVAGAVCNPVLGETFRAVRGEGAFLGDTRLKGPRDIALEAAVIGTGFSYDRARRDRQSAVAVAVLAQAGDLRRIGAASLDICYVAAGRLDGYFEAGLNVWDYAAGALVATEAGCVVSGLRGRPASPRFLAVAAPALAPDLFGVLESAGADRVVSS